MKKNAAQINLTQSAPRIVEVVLASTDVQAPPASLPKPGNMTRIANRVRRNKRLQDP